MPFIIDFQRLPAYLRYEVAGPPSLKNYFDLIEACEKETLSRGDRCVLVVLRGVTGRLPFTDQFFIGDVVGEKLAHLHKLAAVVRDDPSSYNSAKVAVRKGLNLRAFADEAQAVEWLTEQPDVNAVHDGMSPGPGIPPSPPGRGLG